MRASRMNTKIKANAVAKNNSLFESLSIWAFQGLRKVNILRGSMPKCPVIGRHLTDLFGEPVSPPFHW